LIANGHDVDRLNVAMHETFAVQVGEGVQDGFEHRSGFVRRERPAGKNLRKVLLGTLHHDVEQ
jgi:hypothetical protein